MSAFNAHEFTTPPDTEQETWTWATQKWDTVGNFNGQAGVPYEGNFVITGINELLQGALFTAAYGIAGVNTITVQFTAPLQSVSSTTSDYTLSGPSAPSITSVVSIAGSREFILNLSGPLSVVNTYTLAIADRKVLSGSQIGSISPKYGSYNWPNLVVDVILPTQIDTIGVGIEQDIVLGTPLADNTGAMTSVGIEQDIALGTPAIATVVATIGVGVEQDIVLGTPSSGLFDVITGVGIAQTIALGTPVATQQQEPQGVGFVQTISIGTPVADINPLTPTGVGVNEIINLGTPGVVQTFVTQNTVGVGIAQIVALGTPVAVRVNDRVVFGVGVEQDIVLGSPDATNLGLGGVGIEQDITLGSPAITAIAAAIGVGIEQDIALGSPADIATVALSANGVEQDIILGLPIATEEQDTVGVNIEQDIILGLPVITSVVTSTDFNSVGIQQGTLFGLPHAHPVGATLQLTTRQAAAFTDLDTALQQAFGDGVSGIVNPDLIDPIGADHDYRDAFTPLQQRQTKMIFEDLAAAIMTTLNIPGALPVTNTDDTAPIAKTTSSGSAGSLTFVDGKLVSKVDPS